MEQPAAVAWDAPAQYNQTCSRICQTFARLTKWQERQRPEMMRKYAKWRIWGSSLASH